MNWAAFTLSALLFFHQGLANAFVGEVVSIVDGDTIDVTHDGKIERIRLNGIDAPEKGQDYGPQAKQFVEELLTRQKVSIETKGLDKHERSIGDVWLSDGRQLNKELVKAGLAWWYCQYSSDLSLKDLEQEARDAKRGLWHARVPIPPWVYRKLQKKQVPDVADFDCPPVLPQVDSQRATSATSAAPSPGEIIGNKRSQIYHRPDCPGFGKVSAKNRVPFATAKDAEDAGFRVAKDCP